MLPTSDPLVRHVPGTLEHQVEIRWGRRLPIDPAKPRMRFFEPGSAQWWPHGERPKRDSYRRRCYEAENAFVGRVPQRTFTDVTAVARYVRDVMECGWFQRRFPYFQRCTVTHLPGSSVCQGGPTAHTRQAGHTEVTAGFIRISRWGMGLAPPPNGHPGGELVILHELAHAVLPAGHDHDRRWVRTFCEFVGFMLGNEQKHMLMEEFRRRKIPMSPIKTVRFTPEHAQRLAAARPKRVKGGAA